MSAVASREVGRVAFWRHLGQHGCAPIDAVDERGYFIALPGVSGGLWMPPEAVLAVSVERHVDLVDAWNEENG